MVNPRKKPKRDYNQYFCHNEECEDYGLKGKGNIVFHMYYGKNKDRVLLRCRSCNKTFSETRGTPFFRLHTDPKIVVQALSMLVEKGGIRGTGRAFGVDKDTVSRWLERAGEHCEELCNYLFRDLQFTQTQVDEVWTFIKKGEVHHPGRRPRRGRHPVDPDDPGCHIEALRLLPDRGPG